MKKLLNLIVLSVLIVLSSCKKDSPTPVNPILDCNGVVDGIAAMDDCGTCHQSYMYMGMGQLTYVETYADTAGVGGMFILAGSDVDMDMNPNWATLVAPMGYEFNYDGTNTVSYSGQAGRLATAEAVYNVLNASGTTTIDRAALDLVIDNANSKLITKTAENDVNRSTVIDHLNGILDTYCANSSSYEALTVAVPGTAGLKGSYQLDAKGWEGDQQFAKMLIGALCLEQVNYDYLTKMGDETDNTDRTYGDPAVYTKREHYFDEAFGYVYGLDDNDLDADINNGLLLGKYLNKHTNGEKSGIDYRQRAYDAFKMGRQALVENCAEELDRQIAIINSSLSKVVAWHAQDYLSSAANAIGTDDFHHDVSEAWGFVYSLQFTKVNGVPLFSHSQVMTMISTLEAGSNGAWDLEATTLNDMAATINSAVIFD
jgi:hypothetical protein